MGARESEQALRHRWRASTHCTCCVRLCCRHKAALRGPVLLAPRSAPHPDLLLLLLLIFILILIILILGCLGQPDRIATKVPPEPRELAELDRAGQILRGPNRKYGSTKLAGGNSSWCPEFEGWTTRRRRLWPAC